VVLLLLWLRRRHVGVEEFARFGFGPANRPFSPKASRHPPDHIGQWDNGAMICLVTLVVEDYDAAIEFFVNALGFTLTEDSPSTTNAGEPKRWVVVHPPGAGDGTGLLLAKANADGQQAAIGNQTGGRVGFFLRTDDFASQYQRMQDHGVVFLEKPRSEPYGMVVVFRDIAGNSWDLLGPASDPLPHPEAADQ